MVLLNSVLNSSQRQYRSDSTESIRRRALERLYARRTAVDELISSLERYQGAQAARRASCVAITSLKRA